VFVSVTIVVNLSAVHTEISVKSAVITNNKKTVKTKNISAIPLKNRVAAIHKEELRRYSVKYRICGIPLKIRVAATRSKLCADKKSNERR